jgi:hypothetical protein
MDSIQDVVPYVFLRWRKLEDTILVREKHSTHYSDGAFVSPHYTYRRTQSTRRSSKVAKIKYAGCKAEANSESYNSPPNADFVTILGTLSSIQRY